MITIEVRLWQKQTRAEKKDASRIENTNTQHDNFNKLYSFQTIFPSRDSLRKKCIERLFDH